jgi:hypothetical protein
MTTPSQQSSSSTAQTADQYEDAQVREWNSYRARVAIDYYGTRAYNVGDPVPVSAVEGDSAWVSEDYVERIGDNAPAFEGSTTVVDPAPPTIDPTSVAAPAAATPTPITTTEG